MSGHTLWRDTHEQHMARLTPQQRAERQKRARRMREELGREIWVEDVQRWFAGALVEAARNGPDACIDRRLFDQMLLGELTAAVRAGEARQPERGWRWFREPPAGARQVG